MLKLTMNPRKRSKRNRMVPHRLRLPRGEAMDTEETVGNDVYRETVTDNLRAMISQEASGKYSCMDYLSIDAWHQKSFEMKRHPPFSNPGTNSRIDEYCREQIVEWSFRVVDYFRIDRDVVTMSLSFLDRFLATCRCDRTSFKLAATTTLHLAVKLLYPCKLVDLGILSDLSRGEFNMKDVGEMESHILAALEWNLHPPTSLAFCSIFLDSFFASNDVRISPADLDDIYDVSSFFCELAVCDYFFVTMKSSSIALAGILNALEGMFGHDSQLAHEIAFFARRHDFGSPTDLSAARNRLWDLYERSEECALHNDGSFDEDHSFQSNIFVKKMPSNLSPVSVSKPCHSETDFGVPATATSIHHNESW